MLSIRTRLLVAASVLLIVFVVLCGIGLENAFRNSALAAQQERMQGMVYAMLGAADQDEQGRLTLNSEALPEPRLVLPLSGLEAALMDERGRELWRSPSASGPMPTIVEPAIGQARFRRLDDGGAFLLSYGLRWIGPGDRPRRYTVLLTEEPEAYEEQMGIFRRTLWLWLLASAAGLLVALLTVLRWGLVPLRRLVGELHEVETGKRQQIDSPYPTELEPLTGALNAMIRSERSQQTRYRNALGDLAHSLKTPLAVLRNLATATKERAPRDALEEQLGRMQEIVDHQLGRAAMAGRKALAQPQALLPTARKVCAAVGKVYADKSIDFTLDVSESLVARIDSGDLHELLGNLLDNAAKWTTGRVRLRAHRDDALLHLQFDDDGGGFPPDAERLLGRGARADMQTPGQGLGLSAVAELVRAYEGSLQLGRSDDLGGARVSVAIPA